MQRYTQQYDIAFLLDGDMPELTPGDYYSVNFENRVFSGQLTHYSFERTFESRILHINLYGTRNG
jgi:hypothetical protein